jgi:non-ribosomal peptide synthetase component E (peptide arylation enzyme)
MTEGGLTTAIRETPAEKTLTTAGVGLPGLEMRIINQDGKILKKGEIGELEMRGPGIFIGYYRQEDLYKSLLKEDGFFRTGDLATLDHEGYLRITGRLKDLIIRGGVNISPVPIENALSSHPDISGVAVIGYPNERMGELLCAVIIPKKEIPSLESLKKFLYEKGIPKYHCPELLRIVDRFPSTPAGKIRKAVLKEQIIKNTSK